MQNRRQDFRADVSGGCNSIAPNARSIHNHYNYAGSMDAAVKQELEKHYQNMLHEAQREIDECPHLDTLHLKYFLYRVMPPEYNERIEQLRRRQTPGATYNICIGNPDNNTSGARTAVLNDRYLPPPAVDG